MKEEFPHAAPLACCPPRGRFLPWGGPAAKRCPHAAPLACCPPRGRFFALGRPGGKKMPPRCAFGLLPPEGVLFALGRPGGKKMPPRCAFGLLPEGGLLHYGGPIAKNPAGAGFSRKLEAASVVGTGRGEPGRTARKRRSQALYLGLVSL